MEQTLECMMLLAFEAAVLVRFFHFRRGRAKAAQQDVFTVSAIGAGFFAGAAGKLLGESVEWTFVLYLCGALLSAVLLVLMRAGKERPDGSAGSGGDRI